VHETLLAADFMTLETKVWKNKMSKNNIFSRTAAVMMMMMTITTTIIIIIVMAMNTTRILICNNEQHYTKTTYVCTRDHICNTHYSYLQN
jgi:hypothetical protein